MLIKIQGENKQFVEKDFKDIDAATAYAKVYCRGWGNIEIQEVKKMKIKAIFYEQVESRKKVGKKYRTVTTKGKAIQEIERVILGTDRDVKTWLKNTAKALGTRFHSHEIIEE